MMADYDSKAAHHSLIDPLIEPDPSDETGLNAHFGSTFAPRRDQDITPPTSAGIRHQNTGSSVETNPYRRSRASSVSKNSSAVNYGEITPRRQRQDYPSPPNSASPRKERFSNHRSQMNSLNEGRPRRSSNPVSSKNPFGDGQGLTRGGSLRERFPGDDSNRPLDIIRKDSKRAQRAHHLRKKNFNGADLIDRLDKTTLSYHHEGPYDAANMSRNLSTKYSPLAAVRDSNDEALKATPRENIVDSVQRHRPLEGVANIPPGMPDRFGRVLNYEEGTDLQREGPGGDYKRWPGVEYHPDDLKGKGEPSYSIEKALKDHKKHGDSGIEMTNRRRNQSMSSADAPHGLPRSSLQDGTGESSGLGRSSSTGKSLGGTLKKKFGSIRRRRATAAAE